MKSCGQNITVTTVNESKSLDKASDYRLSEMREHQIYRFLFPFDWLGGFAFPFSFLYLFPFFFYPFWFRGTPKHMLVSSRKYDLNTRINMIIP